MYCTISLEKFKLITEFHLKKPPLFSILPFISENLLIFLFLFSRVFYLPRFLLCLSVESYAIILLLFLSYYIAEMRD